MERVGRRRGRNREDWPVGRGEDSGRVGPDRKPIRRDIKVGDGNSVSGDIVGPVDAGILRDFKIESRQFEVPVSRGRKISLCGLRTAVLRW